LKRAKEELNAILKKKKLFVRNGKIEAEEDPED